MKARKDTDLAADPRLASIPEQDQATVAGEAAELVTDYAYSPRVAMESAIRRYQRRSDQQ